MAMPILILVTLLPFICQGLVSQLVDPIFRLTNLSDRYLTNNKHLFKAYKSQPMVVTFHFANVKSALLQINKHRIPLHVTDLTVNITEYLKDGDSNTFSIQDIQPINYNKINDTSIVAYVPYPILTRGTPESVGISPVLLKKVEELIESEINCDSNPRSRKCFPGAALIIVKNGKIVFDKAYGYARRVLDGGKLQDRFQHMKLDTLFDMASNTKMFATLFSLMKLHWEGAIDYLAPLSKYIPKYRGKDRKGRSREDVTVFDVLTHTAGYQPVYEFYNDKFECHTKTKKDTESCLCEVVDFERDRGGVPVYSDLDYILAGLLVEHVAGQELQDYARRCFYAPLKLARTTFKPLKHGFRKEDVAATEVIGNTRNNTRYFKNIRTYVLQGEVDDPTSYHSVEETSGHAGLFSTVHDMAVLAQVLLNRGGYGDLKFWSKDTQDLFVKPYDLDLTFGVGWRRQGNEDLAWHFGKYGSNEAVGHTGWTGTVTVIDPKHDLSVILLTNKKHSDFGEGKFEGDSFETGKYGSVVQLVYESFLNAH